MTKEIVKRSSRGRTPQGEPNPIDVHVGNRIRLRRTLLGLSQEKLASLLGLTFQQVQKYERGMNRVGASRLWDIGKVLEVPINFFYEDMDKSVASQSPVCSVFRTASRLSLPKKMKFMIPTRCSVRKPLSSSRLIIKFLTVKQPNTCLTLLLQCQKRLTITMKTKSFHSS